jgi:hypothetical protein
MPTIRVDRDVYSWLQSQATPFEDNPNSVLRRIAGLGAASTPGIAPQTIGLDATPAVEPPVPVRVTAKQLARRWKIKVRHALYHRDGTFYENLRRFPGALMDPGGYIIFESEKVYEQSPYLRIGKKLNVPGGISAIPSYRPIRN